MYMNKKKLIRLTIYLPMEFPEDWDNDMIEFHLNDSSYCCDNIIDDLKEYSEANGCICRITKGTVIGDYREGDELLLSGQ